MKHYYNLFYYRDWKIDFKNFSSIILLLLISILQSNIIYGKVVTKSNVKTVAQTFINAEMSGHQIKSVSNLFDKKGRKIGYVVNLIPEGYIVLPNNNDISPIILYSDKGKFKFNISNQNILLDFMRWDIVDRYKVLELKSSALNDLKNKNHQKWKDYENGISPHFKSSKQEIYGPFLKTHWGQGSRTGDRYNEYCPLDPKYVNTTKLRSVVGCTTTAASQIIYYWQFPKKITFDNSDKYISYGLDGVINIPEDYAKLDFPSFKDLNSHLSYIKYNNNYNEVGYLCFAVGIKLKEWYSAISSGAYQSVDLYRNLGYGSADYSFSWNDCYNDVINNMKEGLPVQVAISNEKNEGHSVVFDGYNPSNKSFHVNMGWYSDGDNWYIPPALHTDYDFNTMKDVVYNICPYPGWSQWGSDEKNSKRAFYSIPNQDNVKWSVKTKEDRYYSEGLIVSKSGNIIVSNSPMDLNQDKHPSIMIINPEGIKQKEVFLENDNEGISSPVQNRDGKIFVATQKGNIYSIDPNTGKNKIIFKDPNGTEFMSKLKIDDDGLVYAVTDSKLYCLDSEGHQKWYITAPDNYMFTGNTPAIDEARNNVYISCWTTNQQQIEFLIINRLTGQLKKSFKLTNSGSWGAESPSIGKKGNVYFGCKTKLYAIHPDHNYTIDVLYDNGIGYINDAPTIGNDGTLYFFVYITKKQMAVISLDPFSLHINWEIPFSTDVLGNVGYISNIYVDNNNDLCATVHSESIDSNHNITDNGSYLFVFKDNGTSYSRLWNKGIGGNDNFVAFGPNNTMYYCHSNQVTALAELPSNGRSFPNYTNDNPPLKPIYLFPDSNATLTDTTLTFSWNCSDPDGHPLNYILYLGCATDNLSVYKSNIEGNSITINGLLPNSTYVWSVSASDGQTVTQGPVWSFKTKTKTNPVSGGEYNVALSSNGGNASAISEGVYTQKQYAYYANDGDSSSFWASEWDMPAWLKIKFSDQCEIDSVGVWWESDKEEFSISLSNDSLNWTTVVPKQWSVNQEGSSSPTHQVFPIQRTQARFIKINISNTDAPSGNIFQAIVGELEAFGQKNNTGFQNQFIEKSITIYPNPTKSNINIQFKDLTYKNISISLYDIRGEAIITKHLAQAPSSPLKLNLTNYPMGLYYLQIVTNKGIATKKIIIQR